MERLIEEGLDPADFPKPKTEQDHINGVSAHEETHLSKQNRKIINNLDREVPAYHNEK